MPPPDTPPAPASTSSQSQPAPETIAAILPAYNEAGRIGSVLALLQQTKEISEIIVVDDGSIDATADEAAAAAQVDVRVRILRLQANGGKGAALFAGVRATTANILLFLDADLHGLKPEHIFDLVTPVLRDEVDMTIGQFQGGKWNTDLAHWVTPWLSGQRCLRAALFAQISPAASQGYGVETAITLAARRAGWRRRSIPLRGVSHPPSEDHRGLLRGMAVRAHMYNDIVRAWRFERRRRRPLSRTWRGLLLLILALILLGGGSFAYDRFQTRTRAPLTNLDAFPLATVQRLLVVAPHPDDETLGAGGLIQAALAAGIDVRVVVTTNGDGQIVAPLALEHRWVPHAGNYVTIGKRRQQEASNALRTLGLKPKAVVFLGYPDRQLQQLWQNDWTTDCPLMTRLTRTDRNPYPQTLHPDEPYCGSDLLGDMRSLLQDFRPDAVLITHPDDDHPDHRAAGIFMRQAIALESLKHPDFHPVVWGYLIHYGQYPQPRGLHPDKLLFPPAPLLLAGDTWVRFSLTPAQMQNKLAALRAYATQWRLLGSFLPSFVRQDETFVKLPDISLPLLAIQSLDVHEPGSLTPPLMAEPAKEEAHQLVLKGADLVGMHIWRLGDQLWLSTDARGALLRELNYRILIKTPDGRTRIVRWPGDATRLGPSTFAAALNLAEMGYPPTVSFATEVSEGALLDHTSWQITILGNTELP